jgi:hypothetical protein
MTTSVSGNYLKLRDNDLLLRGNKVLVFTHPAHPDRLIKVLYPRAAASKRRLAWLKRNRRQGSFQWLVRTMTEYLTYQCRNKTALDLMPIVYELVQTNYGFGLTVECIRNHDGTLAPTLYDVIQREGLTADLRALVNQLCNTLIDHHIIVSDFKGENLLVVENSKGERRLIVIDGFGERNAIPLSSWSKSWYAMRARKRCRRMLESLAESSPQGMLT